MAIYLGNLSVNQIENRLGIKFTDEDKEFLNNNHIENADTSKYVGEQWHCFDMPFTFVSSTKEVIMNTYVPMFSKYGVNNFKQCLQLGWDKESDKQ